MPNSAAIFEILRVLVIEDARDIEHLLHLRDANFQVEVAHDGTSGLEKRCERITI